MTINETSAPADGAASRPGTRLRSLRSRRRANRRRRRETLTFYAFVSPWLLGFVFLTVFPMALGFYLSLTNYNGLNFGNLKFLGLKNYSRAFNDPDFRSSVRRTIYYAAVGVPLNLVLATVVAFVLTRKIRLTGFFRTLFYIPTVVPIVAAAWMWHLIFDKNFGLLNGVLSWIWPGKAIAWLVDHPTEMMMLLSMWTGLGGGMLILMAGLRNVPQELEDAATVDGANTFQMFRHVTLPLLTPVLLYQTIVYLILAFRVLVEPILLSPSSSSGVSTLSRPVPKDNSFMLVKAYQEIFIDGRFGYGSAMIWYLFVIILVFTTILMWTSKRWVTYER